MIRVSSQTNKKDLLNQLQQESGETTKLFIKLDSLPSFLNTPVAFTIFIYQINSYPRTITWVAGTDQVYSTLRSVKTSIITVEEFERQTGQRIETIFPDAALNELGALNSLSNAQSTRTTSSSPSKNKSLLKGINLSTHSSTPSTAKSIGNNTPKNNVTTPLSLIQGSTPSIQLDAGKLRENKQSNTAIGTNTGLINRATNGKTLIAATKSIKTIESDSKTDSKFSEAGSGSIEKESQKRIKGHKTTDIGDILSTKGVFVQSGTTERNTKSSIFSDQHQFSSSPLIDSYTGAGVEDISKSQTMSDSSDFSDTLMDNSKQSMAQKQNLDIWLERLSATKQALDSLKSEPKQSYYIDSDHSLVTFDANHGSQQIKSPRKGFNNLFFISASMATAVIAVAFILLFPTIVYTVTVKPQQLEESVELTIPKEDFAKRSVKLESTASTPASGQKEVPTERSIGKVSLINPGSRDVSLDNGKFRLIANDREYEAVLNTTLDTTFKIPARNNLNGPAIEFTMQARQPGPEYNLPEGTQLDIVNLLGQKVCLNCYAITISAIQNSQISGDKLVTDADHSLLLGTTESELAKKRIGEIENIQEDTIFTNPNWFQNTGSSYEFSQPVGTITPEVSLKAAVNTDIYYLPKQIVENKIKSQNDNVDSINQIVLVESNGSFANDDAIKTKIYYSYDKKSDISTQDVKQTIKDANCKDVPKDLQQQYPTIDYVDCRNLGIQVPGLTPRVDVTIVKD